jgi:hypothetical protein
MLTDLTGAPAVLLNAAVLFGQSHQAIRQIATNAANAIAIVSGLMFTGSGDSVCWLFCKYSISNCFEFFNVGFGSFVIFTN